MKTFSILGAGWLGLALAKTFKEQFNIILSARNESTKTLHSQLGFESYILTEGVYNNLDTLLTCDYLFINYPPSKFEDYLQFINTLVKYPRFTTIQKIFFVSSTSVYPEDAGVYDEKSTITSSSNPSYYEAEKSLHGKAHIIFRCAGLMGFERIAGKYYTNKLVTDGKSRVNHIHRNDVIRAVSFAINNPIEGIFNLCAPLHPTKEELFVHQCQQCNLTPPHFSDNNACKERIIDGSKLEQLGFEYHFKNPMDFIE